MVSNEISRLKWQCRRGMRELDDLLLNYLETRYELANEKEKRAFKSVLALPDPQLVGYLLQRQRPESAAIAAVVERIVTTGNVVN